MFEGRLQFASEVDSAYRFGALGDKSWRFSADGSSGVMAVETVLRGSMLLFTSPYELHWCGYCAWCNVCFQFASTVKDEIKMVVA